MRVAPKGISNPTLLYSCFNNALKQTNPMEHFCLPGDKNILLNMKNTELSESALL
jgi:hypothetical protein